MNKRQKTEAKESELLNKAIECLDKTTNEGPEDSIDLFGRYVASELRTIDSVQSQHWAKHQIQNILYRAHSEVSHTMTLPGDFGPYQLPSHEPLLRSRTPSTSNSSFISEQWSP